MGVDNVEVSRILCYRSRVPSVCFEGDAPHVGGHRDFIDHDPSWTNTGHRIHPAEEWATACSSGLRVLLQQRENGGPGTKHASEYDGVSLVSWTDQEGVAQVEFISWATKGQGTSGRVAALDTETNRIKAIVPTRHMRLPITFDDKTSEIVWRSTGVKHVKAHWKHNQNQSRVPDHLLRLRSMWRAATCGARIQYGVQRCFVCAQIQAPCLPNGPARRCSLCLLDCHEGCIVSVTDQLKSVRLPVTISAEPDDDGQQHACLSASYLPCGFPHDFVLPRAFHGPTRPGHMMHACMPHSNHLERCDLVGGMCCNLHHCCRAARKSEDD